MEIKQEDDWAQFPDRGVGWSRWRSAGMKVEVCVSASEVQALGAPRKELRGWAVRDGSEDGKDWLPVRTGAGSGSA